MKEDKQVLKRAIRILRKPVLPLLWLLVRDDLYKMVKNAADFPNSACTSKLAIDLTLQGLNESIGEFAKILVKSPRILNSDEIQLCRNGKEISLEFAAIFSKNGSDKSTTHSYQNFYARLICKSNSSFSKILEIGIGSQNLQVPSNMGQCGVPGASLRAWRELFPEAQIVGADIDEDILIFENSIESFMLNQTEDDSWLKFKRATKSGTYNLIIDDGLHSPLANFKTISHSLELLRPQGILVIEDIAERSLPYWLVLLEVGLDGHECQIIQVGEHYLFSITKL